MDRGSGSLAFPTPSSTSGRHRPGPRGVPRVPVRVRLARRANAMRCHRAGGPLVIFASPSERSSLRRAPRDLRGGLEPFPLVGFARLSPLCRSTLRVSTPGSRGLLRSDGATHRHRVPSTWFLTTPTACSTRALRVCCTPLPALRFDAFPALGVQRRPKAHWLPRHSPRRGSYPSKSSPRQQPHRITAAVALLPLLPAPTMLRPAEAGLPITVPWAFLLASRRVPPARIECIGTFDAARCQTPPSAPLRWSSRLQGFSPLTSPLRPTAVSSDVPLVSPMGFVPLQGLSALAPPFGHHRPEPVVPSGKSTSRWRAIEPSSSAWPARRVAPARTAESLRVFTSPPRLPTEVVAADRAAPAKSVREQES
jgi:hypothetical protein